MNAPVTAPVASTAVPKGRLVCYMAGGTGINIAKQLAAQIKKLDMGIAAQVDVVLIDTSESNLAGQKDGSVYLLKGLDGSGKIRKENHHAISRSALSILEHHQPGDLNIVVSSLGGGSGSVIAPVLTRTLLEQDKLVIAVGVATTESAIEVSNTVKTIQSYDAISEKVGKPVVLSIQKNTDSETFDKINEAVISTILLLATLASRKNTGLDTADLRNWLFYNRVPEIKAPVKAVTLDITAGNFGFTEGTYPITVASLARPGVSTKLEWTPDYQCVGYVADNKGFDQPMHYTVCDGELAAIFEELDTLQKELERKAAARQYTSNTIRGVTNIEEDGLVL